MLQAKTVSGGAEGWGDGEKQELSWLPHHPILSTLTSNLPVLEFAFCFQPPSLKKNLWKNMGVPATFNACLLVLKGHIRKPLCFKLICIFQLLASADIHCIFVLPVGWAGGKKDVIQEA